MNRKEEDMPSNKYELADLRAIHMDRSHLPINLPYRG